MTATIYVMNFDGLQNPESRSLPSEIGNAFFKANFFRNKTKGSNFHSLSKSEGEMIAVTFSCLDGWSNL